MKIALACTSFLSVVLSQAVSVTGQLVGPVEQLPNGLQYPLNLQAMGLELPQMTESKLDRVLRNPHTIYYKLPQVWQHYVPASRVEHKNLTLGTSTFTTNRAIWGIFKTSFLADFNANPDFPWETTIGLNVPHRLSVQSGKPSPYDTVNFLALPDDPDTGNIVPVLLLADERPIKWIFPPGTMVGEIIYVVHGGKKYIQEIRTRTKDETQSKWFPGVFRPIKNRAEFQYLTGVAYEPARKYFSFRNPEEDEVFKIDGTVEKLPNIPEQLVKDLLKRPFQNCTTTNWSPTAEQEFHILPKDYSFGLFSNLDSETCAGCHRQTQISVRNLIPREPNIINNPEKVGNIRGCDAVFTWYPFAMQSVREDNKVPMERVIYYRSFDHRNGIVQAIKKNQTADRDYKLTLYVQESLKPYELPDPKYLHTKGLKKMSLPRPDDGLSELQRGVAFQPSVVPDQEAKEPKRYEWQYRSDVGPQYFRNILVDNKNDVVIGVWDPNMGAYRSYNNNTHVVGPATESPVPIPAIVKSRR